MGNVSKAAIKAVVDKAIDGIEAKLGGGIFVRPIMGKIRAVADTSLVDFIAAELALLGWTVTA